MLRLARIIAAILAAVILLLAIPLMLYCRWDTAAYLPAPPPWTAGGPFLRLLARALECAGQAVISLAGNALAWAGGRLTALFGCGLCSAQEMERAFDITLASYGIGAVFYTFFLERSSHRHRGFLKREFIPFALTVLFMSQVLYLAAVSLLIANGARAARAFVQYILALHLCISVIIVVYAICFGRESVLDGAIRRRIRRCAGKLAALARRKERLARRAAPRRHAAAARRANRLYDRLLALLGNVAYDAGTRYGKHSTELDAGFSAMVGILVRQVCRRKALSVYGCYYAFHYAAGCLLCGYRDKRRDECDRGCPVLLLAFFESIYRLAPVGPADAGSADLLLHMLTGAACCALETLPGSALPAYLMKLLGVYQASGGAAPGPFPLAGQPPALFSRLVYALYGRLYHAVAVSGTADEYTLRALRVLRNFPPSAYEDGMQEDLVSHWQIWNRTNRMPVMRSAEELKRLHQALRGRYSAERIPPDRRDAVAILLFGAKRG